MTDADPDRRFRTLLDRLLARTEAGALDWEETPQDDAFVAIFEGGMVKVRRTDRLAPHPTEELDSAREEVFEASLLTRSGQEVREEVFDGFDARGSLGGRLWQSARARARGAGDVLDALLREVGEAGPNAAPPARVAA